MATKFQQIRLLCKSKLSREANPRLVVFDDNGNDIFNFQPDKVKGKCMVSDTELSALNALLAGDGARTFQMKIFADNYICFLTAGGILIGRGHFNIDDDRDVTDKTKSETREENDECTVNESDLETVERSENDIKTGSESICTSDLNCGRYKTTDVIKECDTKTETKNENGGQRMFIAGKTNECTVVFKGVCQSELSLLEMFKCVREILSP